MNIWAGEFGDAYTQRNPVTPEKIRQREKLWGQILNAMLPASPASVLEVGANVGINLSALRSLLPSAMLHAVEPNEEARHQLHELLEISPQPGRVQSAMSVMPTHRTTDLVFTSGVLIHIPPAELLAMCSEIHRVSSRWIVAIEYFSHEPQEVMYRGEMGRLWKRDFGAFYLDNFPDLMPIGCGFAWSRMTGLDDLTWWAFEKR